SNQMHIFVGKHNLTTLSRAWRPVRSLLVGEGKPLISAVDARNAPSSLTGTACGRLRSLLARVFSLSPSPILSPARFFRWALAHAAGILLWGCVLVSFISLEYNGELR
ncbi:hypothetical protein, partial [Desulfovibrio piger]|uniref:hypothetical protein n=1 Tax=Desulfovibrio piger TaxID=901 RepID=UPI0026E9EF28